MTTSDPRHVRGSLPLVRAVTGRPSVIAWAVLALGLLATAAGTVAWQEQVAAAAATRLTATVTEAQAGIVARTDALTQVVGATAGMLESSEEVTREEFLRFTTTIADDRQLRDRFAGLAGLLVVRPDGAGLSVRHAIPESAAAVGGARLSRAEAVRGALTRAVDLATPVTSAALPDPLREALGADLVIVAATYRDPVARTATARLTTRRQTADGFVVALVDAGDLVADVSPRAGRGVALVAYDGDVLATGTRLGSTPPGYVVDAGREDLARTVLVNLADTAWLLRVEALEGFQSAFERAQPGLVAVAGVALSGLLFALTYVLATSRARALVMVEEATAELEATNAELRELTAVVSHDLKSPLTGVLGFLDLLGSEEADLGADERMFVDHANRSATRMGRLIDRLLAFTQADTLVGSPRPVDLGAAIGEVVEELGPDVAARGGELRVGDLPTVPGDGARLVQALREVVANAVAYVPEGRAPQVSVDARREGDDRVVVVRDNGVGIAPEDRDVALRAFQRTARTADVAGHGLGLAICDRIVRAHGGAVELDDAPAGGTEVRIRLPDGARPDA